MQIIQIFKIFPGLYFLSGVFLFGKTSGQILCGVDLPRNRSGNMDADSEYVLLFVNMCLVCILCAVAFFCCK